MRLTRIAGALTRILLLLPLVAGTRVDCGVPDSPAGRSEVAAPDCHAESSHEHGGRPAAPHEHHGGGPAGGHCPAYHSCALDTSFNGRALDQSELVPTLQPAPSRINAFPSLTQLPEVPPPRV